MSWYTAHILSIITFLPLVGAVVIAFTSGANSGVHPPDGWRFIFSLLTFMITVCLYSRFDPHTGGMQFYGNVAPG